MRLLLGALVSVGVYAQENVIPPAQAQNIIKKSFAQRDVLKKAAFGLGQQKLQMSPVSKVCSVPLLNVMPKVEGTMRTITPPQTEFNMPKLQMPAPACK